MPKSDYGRITAGKSLQVLPVACAVSNARVEQTIRRPRQFNELPTSTYVFIQPKSNCTPNVGVATNRTGPHR